MAVAVDFYLLTEASLEAGRSFIGRLIEKIYKQQRQVYVHVESAAVAEQFNNILWTFRDISFVPHRLYSEDPENIPPVQIGFGAAPKADINDVLVNLSTEVPEFYAQFQRVLEIIPNDTALKAAGRKKYKSYQTQGCELKAHDMA